MKETVTILNFILSFVCNNLIRSDFKYTRMEKTVGILCELVSKTVFLYYYYYYYCLYYNSYFIKL